MNDLTFNILKLVLSVVAALVGVYLVPYIKNRHADERYAKLVAMVEVAVHAAEQTIGSGEGKLKKEEVMKFVLKWMSENGIKISEEQLDQIIEACVFNMNLEIK